MVSSQSPESLLKELRRLGVDIDLVSKENRLRIVDWFSWSEETVTDIEERGVIVRTSVDLTNAGVAVSRAIAALHDSGSRRAVVEMLSPAMNVYEVGQVYAFAQSTKRKFDRFRFTALFLLEKEMHQASALTTLHQPFDGVIEIERTRVGDRIVRKIGVLHLKETTPISDFVPFEYTDQGIDVGPKVPTLPLPPSDLEKAKAAPQPALVTPAPPAPSPPPASSPVEERAGRLRIIQGIARERLKIDSEDRDALFTLAAAQAVLDDPRGAVQTLQKLETIDSSYPGLYALEMKLFARLGEAEQWQRSRQKALEASVDEEGAGPTPCPFCKEQVPAGAVQCPHCMADLREETDLFRGLEDLVRATVQEIVQEELTAKAPEAAPVVVKPEPSSPCPLCQSPVPPGAAQCPECKADLREESALLQSLEDLVKEALAEPMPKGAEAPVAAPELARPRAEAKAPVKPVVRSKGLTNGLILNRKPVRSAPAAKGGRTNGLKGRTNGLRGRTNGLTNGLGRTNGLTNGLRGRTNGLTNGLRGRTNGLTNGLGGRTNGLTNGLGGRTNGLTNGLRGRTNGLTNGLGRTNGLTNGVGRTNGLTNGLARVAKSRGMFGRGGQAQWKKLSLAAVLVVLIILLPIVLIWTGPTVTYPIHVDGQFADWSGVTRVAASLTQVAPNPDIDITQVAVKDNIDFLAFYIQVAGSATAGGPAPTRTTDAFFAFIDTDRSHATGYQVQGIGADRMVRINTWGGQIVSASLLEFDPARGHQDWNGWIAAGSVDAAASGSQIEFQVSWLDLPAAHVPVEVAFASRSWEGQSDAANVVVTNAEPFLLVSQMTAAPQVVASATTDLARFSLRAQGGDVTVTGLNVTCFGTFGASAVSAVDLVDETGTILAETLPAQTVRFDFSPLTVSKDQVRTLVVRLKINTGDGSTIGMLLLNVSDVRIASGGVAFVAPARVPQSLAYVGMASGNATVDGGFADWPVVMPDSLGDVQPVWNPDVDLSGYAFQGHSGNTYFMAQVVGAALNGTMMPAFNPTYVPPSNGTSNGTVGPPVSPPPPENGTDAIRFFLDVDGSASTGYSIGGIGADYLIEITGKEGVVLSAAARRFAGASPTDWAWMAPSAATAAKDATRIEAVLPGVAITNASRSYFQTTGWDGAHDDSAPAVPVVALALSASSQEPSTAPLNGEPSALRTLTLSTQALAGNQQWFFTNTGVSGGGAPSDCSGTGTNLVASVTAGNVPTNTQLGGFGGDPNICWYTPTQTPTYIPTGTWEFNLDMGGAGGGRGYRAQIFHCTASNCGAASQTLLFDTNSTTFGTNVSIVTPSIAAQTLGVNDRIEFKLTPTGTLITGITISYNGPSPLPGTSDSWASLPMVKSGNQQWYFTSGTPVGAGNPNDCTAGNFAASTTPGNSPTNTQVTTGSAICWYTPTGTPVSTPAGVWQVNLDIASAGGNPSYRVQIYHCTNNGCSSKNLLFDTNSSLFGTNVSFATPSIAAQTLGSNDRIEFKITAQGSGQAKIQISYNGPSPNPGTSDSWASVPIPEFSDLAIPIAVGVVVPFVLRGRFRRETRKAASRA